MRMSLIMRRILLITAMSYSKLTGTRIIELTEGLHSGATKFVMMGPLYLVLSLVGGNK
jgi:hypothetical protein